MNATISCPRIELIKMAVEGSDIFKDAYLSYSDLGREAFFLAWGEDSKEVSARYSEYEVSQYGWLALASILNDWNMQEMILSDAEELSGYSKKEQVVLATTAMRLQCKCRELCPKIFEVAELLRRDSGYVDRVLEAAVSKFKRVSGTLYPEVQLHTSPATYSIDICDSSETVAAACHMKAHLSDAIFYGDSGAERYINCSYWSYEPLDQGVEQEFEL